MAAKQTSSQFKTYQRGRRTQTSDESFAGGQVFTRTPLAPANSRLLVNYDLLYEGDAITPRKGYRASMVGLPFDAGDFVSELELPVTANKCVDTVEEDNVKYRLVVVDEIDQDAEPVEGTNLYTASSELWAIESDPRAQEFSNLPKHGIKCRNMMAYPISHTQYPNFSTTADYHRRDRVYHWGTLYECIAAGAEIVSGPWDPTKWSAIDIPKSYYYIPSETKAHGIEITNKRFLAEPVGCFAWDDNYYNYNTEGIMVRNVYVPSDGVNPARYEIEELLPSEISCSEALTSGFNLAQPNPYAFYDYYAAGTINFEGFMFYKSGTVDFSDPNSLASPLIINNSYCVRVYYSGEKDVKYKFVFSYGPSSGDVDSFVDFSTQEITLSGDTPPVIKADNFKCPYEAAAIVIKAYRWDTDTNDYEESFEMYSAAGFTCVPAATESTAKKTPPSYDMSKVHGLVYWKNYLWAYGHPNAKATLFRSALNEPTYFPYPQGVHIYDEPIIAVVPFNEYLLVFTRSQVIQITLNASGTGWTNKILQSNMNFTEFDARFIQTVKNMMFFKSGDYYYMIVPKTLSVQNELAIAPVSKNITYFLDDFYDNCKNLIKVMYNYEGTLELVNHYNYLDYEDVHNVYTFATEHEGIYLSVILLYNTVDRTWRTYTYESQGTFYPIRQNATNQTELMLPLEAEVNGTGCYGIQFVDRNSTSVKDLYIPYGFEFTKTDDTWDEVDEALDSAFENTHKFYNYTVMDTGYRDLTVDLNKRYRELQIKFNNVSGSDLRFSTEFIIDGETRINAFKYIVQHDTDPDSESYGSLYIDRIPVENISLPGHTILGEDEDDINAWTLDNSAFPEIAFWKARLKVSGKGYTPRFRVVCMTEEIYELLGYTWVYRMMYSR